MYSRTILLTAASLAVAGMAEAAPLQNSHQPLAARAHVSAGPYRLLSEPHFLRGHYVAKSINPSGRVVLVEINPEDGALIGEIFL